MRFPLAIIATLVISYAIAFYISVPAYPEVSFWQKVIEIRDSEIADVRKHQADTSIVFFTGGSSTAFSIDPKIIESATGMPCFNLGLPVAIEAKYLLHQALLRANSGDFIVVSLELEELINYQENNRPSKLGFALAVAGGYPQEAAGGETFDNPTTFNDYLTFSRPGANILPTIIARKILNKPYRYSLNDLRYHGRIETQIHDSNMPAVGLLGKAHLTQDAVDLLTRFKQAADKKNVNIAFSLPWIYTANDNLMECREEKIKILHEIETIMPVIKDDFSGCADVSKWCADTPMHLSSEGSKIRTEAVVVPLKSWLINP